MEIKRPKCKRMILCCSYRPDHEIIDGFISNKADSLTNIDTENSDIVLVGDFNVDYSTKNQLRRKLDEFAVFLRLFVNLLGLLRILAPRLT